MGQAFNRDVQQEMGAGSRMTLGPYTIVCQNFDQSANANYESERAMLEIIKNGKSEMMLYPERRFYLASQVTETMVAIQSTPLRDLYVVYAGRSPESNRPVIHAYLNPLVKCIWFGGLIVVIGTLLALVPSTQPVIVLRAVTEPAPAAGAAPMPHSIGVAHGQD